jgi:hypothetical protein
LIVIASVPIQNQPGAASTGEGMKARLIEQVFMPVNLTAPAGLKIASGGYFRQGYRQFC